MKPLYTIKIHPQVTKKKPLNGLFHMVIWIVHKYIFLLVNVIMREMVQLKMVMKL